MGLIERMRRQTALYWGSPVPNGVGGWNHAFPVEIACRWEDRQEMSYGATRELLSIRSVVYVDRVVEQDGYLYLGSYDNFIGDEVAIDSLLLDISYFPFTFTITKDNANFIGPVKVEGLFSIENEQHPEQPPTEEWISPTQTVVETATTFVITTDLTGASEIRAVGHVNTVPLDPATLAGAGRIQRMDVIPNLRDTKKLRVAYL